MSFKPSHLSGRAQLSPRALAALERLGAEQSALARLAGQPCVESHTDALSAFVGPLVAPPQVEASRTPAAAPPVAMARSAEPRAPFKRTRKDAKEREAQHTRAALARFESYLVGRGVAVPSAAESSRAFAVIPRDVWVRTWQCVADRSGESIRREVRRLPNLPARTALLRAALGIDDAGRARYSWAQLRARRIAALGLALLMLARRTRRRDAWGGGLVMGLNRSALCALLRDVHDQRAERATPSVSALVGTHRSGATSESGEVGYLVALVESGFCYRMQLPRWEAEPCETSHGGDYATNRYLITSAIAYRVTERFRDVLKRWAELAIAVGAGWERALGLWSAPEPAPPL